MTEVENFHFKELQQFPTMISAHIHTCRKSSPEEDVEELLWGDVSLKVPRKVAVVCVRVARLC